MEGTKCGCGGQVGNSSMSGSIMRVMDLRFSVVMGKNLDPGVDGRTIAEKIAGGNLANPCATGTPAPTPPTDEV
jgi:hypothetical protein